MKTIKKPANSIYPWGAWFARRKFTLKRGVDYMVQSWSMAQMFRNRSAYLQRKGEEVRVEVTACESQINVEIYRNGKESDNARSQPQNW